jgi:hypothetical protein
MNNGSMGTSLTHLSTQLIVSPHLVGVSSYSSQATRHINLKHMVLTTRTRDIMVELRHEIKLW